METSISVANYFIEKSRKSHVLITPMKIIKLTYISFGWYSGLYQGNILFNEDIQAWKYGPVISSLYHELKSYKNNPVETLIESTVWNNKSDQSESTFPLPKDKKIVQFLDRIWEIYSKFTALQLSAYTHQQDSPWDIAWNRLGGKNKDSFIIPIEVIANYYKLKANGK